MRSAFLFLHPAYLEWATEDREDFITWLVLNYNLNVVPRLAEETVGRAFKLSPEFEFILGSFQPTAVLLLLRSSWPEYRRWIIPGDSRKEYPAMWHVSKNYVRQRIASLKVVCRGGKLLKLSQTALPLPVSGTDRTFGLDFIDLPDAESEEWEFLRYFGVKTTSDRDVGLEGTPPGVHIARLHELRQDDQPSVEVISDEYTKLFILAQTELQAIQ